MSFSRNNKTGEPRKSAVDNGPRFRPRTSAVKLYDPAGRSLGTFADVRDAWAALDSLDTAA